MLDLEKNRFLFTDVVNPTLQKIYRDIGYNNVRDHGQLLFTKID